ncbi:MAG: hypothetical protein V8S32_01740 [Lachnospiraceae bacterium]
MQNKIAAKKPDNIFIRFLSIPDPQKTSIGSITLPVYPLSKKSLLFFPETAPRRKCSTDAPANIPDLKEEHKFHACSKDISLGSGHSDFPCPDHN